MFLRKSIFSLIFISLLAFQCVVIKADEDPLDNENESKKKEESTQTETELEKGGPSSDAQTVFLFTSEHQNSELVSGKIVKFLIGFRNLGEKDFIVRSSETSFRYPMDFNYYIQNFTAAVYNRVVSPKQEITVGYSFIPSEAFIGRPLGLVVNLNYVDTAGTEFINTVFNETISVVEDESTFNTETGFLVLTLGGIAFLILFVVHNYFSSKFTRKQNTFYQPKHEMGTDGNDIDYEWIPRANLIDTNKSPKHVSPRQRKQTKAH